MKEIWVQAKQKGWFASVSDGTYNVGKLSVSPTEHTHALRLSAQRQPLCRAISNRILIRWHRNFYRSLRQPPHKRRFLCWSKSAYSSTRQAKMRSGLPARCSTAVQTRYWCSIKTGNCRYLTTQRQHCSSFPRVRLGRRLRQS